LKKGGFAFFFLFYLGLGAYSNNSFVAYLGSKNDKLIIPVSGKAVLPPRCREASLNNYADEPSLTFVTFF
jgi:hypothetical protein